MWPSPTPDSSNFMQGCAPLHACAHAESSEERSAYTVFARAQAAREGSAAEDFATMLLEHGADPAVKNQQASTYCCSTCSLSFLCMTLQECVV